MKTPIKEGPYNVKLQPSDWRYSAAIVGLLRYFRYFEKDNIEYSVEPNCIKYKQEDITEERYLEFAEYFYGDGFHHIVLEKLLKSYELSEEQIKLANKKLKVNTVMKKIFKGCQIENDKDKILDLLDKNRFEIIRETFKNKSDMYANYCNEKQYFNSGKCSCRLIGYYVDAGKKSKSLGYQFQNNAINFDDCQEFEFIPFAFAGYRSFYFINDSFNIHKLLEVNDYFKQCVVDNIIGDEKFDGRQILFKSIMEISDFINYDVEVILKETGIKFFETVFIRKQAINILKNLSDSYKGLNKGYEGNGNYKMDIYEESVTHILNGILCDDIIEKIIGKNDYRYTVKILIKINMLIKGVNEMTNSMKAAYAAAMQVAKAIPENKLDSFRQKLISAVTFKDYDRAMLILLNLSAYADVRFSFANDLFENFEQNKEVMYTFINSLTLKEEK